MAAKKNRPGSTPSRRTKVVSGTCILFELNGDLSLVPKIIEEISNGNPPKDNTDAQSPGLGIKNDHHSENGWFFATGIKAQDNILPHTISGGNPTQSTPLNLTDEEFLATPVTFALNIEKKLLITVSSPNGITATQIMKLMSKGRGHASRKELKRRSASFLQQLAQKAKTVTFKYLPNDKIGYLAKNGIAGIGQDVEVSTLEVCWKLKKHSKKEYADMSKEVLEAHNVIRNDLSGAYHECKLTAINSAGEEETIDLFDQFISYKGVITTTGRDITFQKFVDLLKEAIRSMPL
jgi:hypothetical protein